MQRSHLDLIACDQRNTIDLPDRLHNIRGLPTPGPAAQAVGLFDWLRATHTPDRVSGGGQVAIELAELPPAVREFRRKLGATVSPRQKQNFLKVTHPAAQRSAAALSRFLYREGLKESGAAPTRILGGPKPWVVVKRMDDGPIIDP